ncbi:hypothetical protein NECAME_11521, partial [Necator americanus]
DEFNTYVTVKLQNVKSTTAVVRGNQPCWEQEFIFETNRLDEGMIIELWSKGVLWDRLLGVHFMPLTDVRYCAAPGDGKWLQMDQELETRNGQTIGTSKPTGHNVLVDSRFELPFDRRLRGGPLLFSDRVPQIPHELVTQEFRPAAFPEYFCAPCASPAPSQSALNSRAQAE